MNLDHIAIEGIVALCGEFYGDYVTRHPHLSPHEHLTMVLCALRKMDKGLDSECPTLEDFLFTKPCACVAPPGCAKALAYRIIKWHMPSLRPLFDNSSYQHDYYRLMEPFYEARRQDRAGVLYCRFNHNPILRDLILTEDEKKSVGG